MRLVWIVLLVFCVTATAQSNPVPFVSQALTPTGIQPGSVDLALMVNGIGFAPTALVNWNGSAALSGTWAPPPKVSLQPTRLTFSTQLVGTTSPAQTATLTNIGTRDVTIFSIWIVSFFGMFEETDNCPPVLGISQSCQFQIVFQPTNTGPARGILYIHDDAEGDPHQVRFAGTGTVISFAPIGVNFGNQKIGTRSAAAPITLTNTGDRPVSIKQVTITGTNPGDFKQTNDCGHHVPAHSSCTISVTFKPTAAGPRSAAISVTDGGGGSPQSLPLTGTGT